MSWRGAFVVQASLSLLFILGSFILPETPRWLIKNGFKTEGLWTLADLHGHGDITDIRVYETYTEIVTTLEFEERECQKEASWGELFTRYSRRTFIGITSQMFAQLNGINAILHFLPENFARAGFTVPMSLLHSGLCAVIYCLGIIPTIFYIDKLGRRLFLLIGSVGLAVSLAAVGGLQLHVDSIPQGTHRWRVAEGIFGGVCMYLFVFGATWGPTPWILGAEIFPTRARAKGEALSAAADWTFNFIVAMITPSLFEVLPGGYYFLLVGSCIISFLVVYFFYPETAHNTLEELGQVFGDEKPPPISVNEFFMNEVGGLLEVPGTVTRPSLEPSINSAQTLEGSIDVNKTVWNTNEHLFG